MISFRKYFTCQSGSVGVEFLKPLAEMQNQVQKNPPGSRGIFLISSVQPGSWQSFYAIVLGQAKVLLQFLIIGICILCGLVYPVVMTFDIFALWYVHHFNTGPGNKS